MTQLNPHFDKFSNLSFFPEVERRIADAKTRFPENSFINLGIGDVTKPLLPSLLSALCAGSQEMGEEDSFRGYGPSQGYAFLREAIRGGEYGALGITIDEIFVSNGARTDLSVVQELFSPDCKIAVCDPSYPIPVDTNVLAGRTQYWSEEKGGYEGVVYIPCFEENGFVPLPPSFACDLIYLCSPNNPTGVALDRKTLCLWVEYALAHKAVLIFDGAYESFVSSDLCPRSIYEIDGAKETAIEIRSFSKTAGFTGLRCSYTVVPKELRGILAGKEVSLHSLYKRLCETKFGGVPYPIQKCAAAVYTPEGQKEVAQILGAYKASARFLYEGLRKLGWTVFGGIDSPYIWCKTLHDLSSWDFFEYLLDTCQVICVPGSGFGRHGEGYIRLSAFAQSRHLAEALLRFKKV